MKALAPVNQRRDHAERVENTHDTHQKLEPDSRAASLRSITRQVNQVKNDEGGGEQATG